MTTVDTSRYASALAALLNRFAAAASAQRRELEGKPREARDGTIVLRVRCDGGCTRRVAAVHATALGRLVVPYGRTLVYQLPSTDAVAPELPGLLVRRPELAPELAAAVFGYLRQHVTGGTVPTEQQYAQLCTRIGDWQAKQPVRCRCECSGGSEHELDLPVLLRQIRRQPREIGVSAVTADPAR